MTLSGIRTVTPKVSECRSRIGPVTLALHVGQSLSGVDQRILNLGLLPEVSNPAGFGGVYVP